MKPDDAARHGARGDAAEACIADHAREGGGSRETADRFDEVAVGLGIAGDEAAHFRNEFEGEGIIDCIEAGDVHGGKFETEETSAALEHAIGFRQCEVHAGDIADAEGDGIGVEGLVGQGQALGIGLDVFDSVLEGGRGAVAADGEHFAVNVEYGGAGAGARSLHDAEGDVAGAARNVEEVKRTVLAGPERGDEGVFPDAVQADRHEIVHQVVARGDLVEHVVDEGLLPAKRDRGKTEMGFV